MERRSCAAEMRVGNRLAKKGRRRDHVIVAGAFFQVRGLLSGRRHAWMLFNQHRLASLLASADKVELAIDAPRRCDAQGVERLSLAHAGYRERADEVEE